MSTFCSFDIHISNTCAYAFVSVCIRGCLTKAREFIASYVFLAHLPNFNPAMPKLQNLKINSQVPQSKTVRVKCAYGFIFELCKTYIKPDQVLFLFRLSKSFKIVRHCTYGSVATKCLTKYENFVKRQDQAKCKCLLLNSYFINSDFFFT